MPSASAFDARHTCSLVSSSLVRTTHASSQQHSAAVPDTVFHTSHLGMCSFYNQLW